MSIKKIFSQSFLILSKNEQNKFLLLFMFHLLFNILDILLLAYLLGVVSVYNHNNNSIVSIIPKTLRNTESIYPFLSLLILFIFKNTAAYYLFSNQSKNLYAIASRISREKLLEYMNNSFDFYVQSDRSKIFNLVNNRPLEFVQNILLSLQSIVTEFALTIITIVGVLIFKPQLFAFLSLFLVPPIIIASLIIRKKTNFLKQNINKDSEKANQYFYETFGSYVESRIYRKELFFVNRHSFFHQNLSSHLSQLQIIQWIPSRIVEIFAILGLFVLVIFNNIYGYNADIIDIGAFIVAAYKIMPSVVKISNSSALIRTYAHVLVDLNQKIESSTFKINTKQNSEIQAIEISNLYFRYNNISIIENLNFVINQGDFVCITGPSGKGKSTLLNLMLGFLEPSSGNIIWKEGNSIKEKKNTVAYVKQQSFLIQDTIERNISLEEDASNPKLLKKVIALSGLYSLISNVNYSIPIAEDGKDISGGQKQRIAFARALYSNAQVILLDEPFNELDSFSENELLQNIKKICVQENKIIVLVSHNTLCHRYATKILML